MATESVIVSRRKCRSRMSGQIPSGGRGELSTDIILELLSQHRRRTLLDVLWTHDEPLADLAEEVTIREQDECVDAIPADDVKQVYLMLYHQHVQKLDEYEGVVYDQDRDMAALTDRADALGPFLELANERA